MMAALSSNTRAGGGSGLAGTESSGSTGLSVFDCAEYILRKTNGISPIKLHRLLYYAQAWSLVWDAEPIFPERIEAWHGGPVIPDLYRAHEGNFNVETVGGDPGRLSDDQKETIDIIIRDYGPLSSQRLGDLVRSEMPWRNARKGIPSGERGNAAIPLSELQEYYDSLPSD